MTLVATFVVMLVVNSVVLYLANAFVPEMVVLGTMSMSAAWAIVHSMGTLALVDTLALPFMYQLETWKGRALTSAEWMFQYFVVNFAVLYLITRFSDQFGLGVSSWFVVVVLAIVLDMVQGLAMMQLGKMQAQK